MRGGWLSPRWRKVARDVAGNRARTLLVVLSIAVGVFALVTIGGTQETLKREMDARYAATHPASATLHLAAFDETLVETVRTVPGVAAAEGQRSLAVRLQVGPDRWVRLQLRAYEDFEAIQLNQVLAAGGAWPPPDRTLLIERAALPLLNTELGERLTIELPDGTRRELPLAGLAYDMHHWPSNLLNMAWGYVTLDTMEWLGEPSNFNELHIVVAEQPLDRAHIREVAEAVRAKVEKSGREVRATEVPPPGEHWADDIVQTMLSLLGALGFLALVLGGFLIVNIVSALLTQQVRQIGVMKAIGGGTGQIVSMYLVMVLLFSLLALALAIPPGILAARAMTNYAAAVLNFDPFTPTLSPAVLARAVGAGVIVPLLAALWPILAGARITIREAIASYGLGEAAGKQAHWGTGLTEWVPTLGSIPLRPVLLSLRNTVRRKARLALTLVTLTLAGAIFVAVISLRDSLFLTLDDAYRDWRSDLTITLGRPYREAQLAAEAMRVPGVVAVEGWHLTTARRPLGADRESEAITIFAPPPESPFFRPAIVRGRWLLPGDEAAVVVTTDLLKDEPDLDVGGEVVLKLDGREQRWRIVGVAQVALGGRRLYAPVREVGRVIGEPGRANLLVVQAAAGTAEYHQAMAQAVEAHFKAAGLRVNQVETISEQRGQTRAQFDILIVFLLAMALLLGAVGGLGLTGTMSINVLERRREIGVMRAIGASDGMVLSVVMVEGVLIGLVSWGFGALCGWPLGRLMAERMGLLLLNGPLSYTYAWSGALLWLGVVALLSAGASFVPAWQAARLTIREVLAYE